MGAIIDDDGELAVGLAAFEELIWKRINEQPDDDAKRVVAGWVAEQLARVQHNVAEAIALVSG